MKNRVNIWQKSLFLTPALSVLIALIAFAATSVARAQNLVEPRQDQLLNGLKVLVWSEPKSESVTVRLRVHAGAAFDPAGKPGVTKLLGDILFPEEGTKDFFQEELGGKLEVVSNYNFIEITASGKSSEFERILDTVRTAVATPPITADTFKKVRAAQLKRLQETAQNPATIADEAVAKRLFGDFPYGRPAAGTPESMAKIELGDLIFARDRFLTADNSTLAISGNVDARYAVKAAKQLFGSWRKADRIVPATFRQPDAIDDKIVIVDVPKAETAEIRLAVRGLAQNDRDVWASGFWLGLTENKLKNELPKEWRDTVNVRHDAHLLPGIVVIRAAVPPAQAAQAVKTLQSAIAKAANEKVNAAEFAKLQQEVLEAIKTQIADPNERAKFWLSTDTYKRAALTEQFNQIKAVTPGDGDRVAAKLFKNAPMAVVVVGNAEQIQPQFDGK